MADETKRACRVLRGQFTQYDAAGQAHVFSAGDEIELTDEEIEADGGASFEVLRVVAAPRPAPAPAADEG